MVAEMRTVYSAEVERYLASVSGDEVELIAGALTKVTGSTCDAEGKELAGAQEAAAAA